MAVTEGSIFSGFPAISSALAQFIVQLVIILLLTRILVVLLRPLKQPSVIAEVIAGILLGPSAFGRSDAWMKTIFPAESLPRLQLFANVALVLFMFLVGIELDVKVLTRNLRRSIAISITGILLPFALGAAVAVQIFALYPSPTGGYTSFLLFGGTAMSITAFPVLARILSEMQLLGTKLGATTMNAAAVDDVMAWTILGVVIALSRSSSSLSALWTILSTLAFVLFMLIAVRPLLTRLARHVTKSNKETGDTHSLPTWFFVMMILLCMVSAYVTEILGVHAIFGGFIAGIAMPRERNLHLALGHRIEDLVVAILLPLYFTFSGLRTQFNSLSDPTAWGCVLLVITAAVVGKLGGCSIAARLTGMNWRESITTGAFMNAKGLVELIVLNVGLDLGVLTPLVFSIFVFMALITTFMTVPLIYWVYPPEKIREDDRKAIEAMHAAEAAVTEVGVELDVLGTQPSGFRKLLLPSFGPEGTGSLLTLASILLRPTTTAKPLAGAHASTGGGAAHRDTNSVDLCHILPVTDRPSSYLHTMTQAVVDRFPAVSLFFTATASPKAGQHNDGAVNGHAATPARTPSRQFSGTGNGVDTGSGTGAAMGGSNAAVPTDVIVDHVERDMTLMLGLERARHVGLLDTLLLSQTHTSDAVAAIKDTINQSGTDLVLLNYDPVASVASGGRDGASVHPPTPGDAGVGGVFNSIMDRFLPFSGDQARTAKTLMSLSQSGTRVGLVMSPKGGAFFGPMTVAKALFVIFDPAAENELLRSIGGVFIANGVHVEVLLLVDIPGIGAPLQPEQDDSGSEDEAVVPHGAPVVKLPAVLSVATTVTATGTGATATNEATKRAQALQTAAATALLLGARTLGSAASATPSAIAAMAATMHLAHPTSLAIALRALQADSVLASGAGFDVIVASTPGIGPAAAAAPSGTAAQQHEGIMPPSIGSGAQSPLDGAVLLNMEGTGAPVADTAAAVPTTTADQADDNTVAAPRTQSTGGLARVFPRVRSASGAQEQSRRSTRASTLAHLFGRGEEGVGGDSILGEVVDRIVGAEVKGAFVLAVTPTQ